MTNKGGFLKIQQEDQFAKSSNIVEMVNETDSLTATQPQQKEPAHSPTEYRPDIDGLRAIAVGIVVIFHAWPESFTGGFIGVDVFFVISGYFISQILIKENLKGSFSYFNFYNRRVKRIYPALLVVLLFVLYLTIRYSDNEHLKMTTKTMAASTIFGANIEVLTYKQGYWDASVKTNPLLHLWSLGVEEQFYIFWPFVITLILTKFRSSAFGILSGYTVLSFIFNLIAGYISAKFDFYFPFCRCWQMAVGGLLALKGIKISDRFYANALSALGLFIIISASFFLSELNLYPGWWALLPTFAAAAVILAGADSVCNKHILSNQVMVFIGKISYSLYLWHWPLLVLSRAFFPAGSDTIWSETWFIVLLSAFLSLNSYTFIENPLRFSKKKSIFYILLVIMFFVGAASVAIYNKPELVRGKGDSSEDINVVDVETKNQAVSPTSPQIANKPKVFKNDLEQYRYEIIPTEQDYYQKDGKKIPNWSVSKNRTPPTVRKIKQSQDIKPFYNNVLFDKRVDNTSKYYLPDLPNIHLYAVANQGRQKMVLLYGDSNAHYTAFRFGKLYEDAKKENRLHELPTFVAILYRGTTLIPYEKTYNFFLNWVEKFKPDRVMLIYFWRAYKIYHGHEDFQKNHNNQKDEYFYQNIISYHTNSI